LSDTVPRFQLSYFILAQASTLQCGGVRRCGAEKQSFHDLTPHGSLITENHMAFDGFVDFNEVILLYDHLLEFVHKPKH
jgi:hypothetical protein